MSATFVEGANDGTLNGVTDVTLVAAPAASTRRVVYRIIIYNKDTQSNVITLKYDNNGTQRTMYKVTLAIGDTLIWKEPLILDTTLKTIKVAMSSAIASVNPDFVSTYGDASG